ncbi:MAG: hypothetical protein ACTHNK_22080 [Thermomicrobiales bacterium]|jgi:hypothetical protein
MFRKPPLPTRPTMRSDTHEARLRALGYLLDQRGYAAHGLCILAVEDGFEVTGLLAKDGVGMLEREPQAETITVDELAAALAGMQSTS